jgi:hypothetical protein
LPVEIDLGVHVDALELDTRAYLSSRRGWHQNCAAPLFLALAPGLFKTNSGSAQTFSRSSDSIKFQLGPGHYELRCCASR